MKKTTTIEEINKKQDAEEKTIILPSGLTVKFNPNKINGHTLMQARKLAGVQDEISLSIYVASIACFFDEDRKTVNEILDLSMADILTLEDELLKTKK